MCNLIHFALLHTQLTAHIHDKCTVEMMANDRRPSERKCAQKIVCMNDDVADEGDGLW